MYQINFPSQGKSWLFDASSNLWTILESGLSGGRHRGEILADFLNKPRISDYTSGDVYTLSPDVYTDNGVTIPREIISRHLNPSGGRIAIHKLQIDVETGVGLEDGIDPQAMLQISKDNGHTWGYEKWTGMGSIGGFLRRVIWRRLGISYDWTFRFRVTDPVKIVISAAYMDMEARP